MKRGLQEWPLVVFTLAVQTAVGMLVWFTSLSLLKSPPPISGLAASSWALVLTAVGMLVSLLHLGNPQRAYMAMRRTKKSWISREVVFAVAFGLSTACLTLSGLLSPPFFSPPAWLLWLSSSLGVGLVYAMIQVYRLRTAPGWAGPLNGPGFFLTSLLLGGSLLAWLAAPSGLVSLGLSSEPSGSLLRSGLLACLALQAGLVLLGLAQLSRLAHPAPPGSQNSAFLRIGLLFAAFSVLILGQLLASTAVVLAAELVGRITFYAARHRLGV